MSEAGGGDLFIVDNSVSGWTGLEYLRQWSDLARSFDIATEITLLANFLHRYLDRFE